MNKCVLCEELTCDLGVLEYVIDCDSCPIIKRYNEEKQYVQNKKEAVQMKKVDNRTRQTLLEMMVYLYYFPGHEGEGGKQRIDLGDDWYKGTRLRQPSFPLHNKSPKQRQELFQILLDTNMIEIFKVDDNIPFYQVTEQGKSVLHKLPQRLVFYTSWYKWMDTGVVWTNKHMAFVTPEEAQKLNINNPGANSAQSVTKIFNYPQNESKGACA